MIKPGDTFSIGEVCPESGVYRIKGCACTVDGDCKKCDISPEQYTIPLVKGKKFPPCRNCKDENFKWEFVRPA